MEISENKLGKKSFPRGEMSTYDRRLLVMKALAAGVLQHHQLIKECFLKNDGTLPTRGFINRFLSKMVEAELIVRKKFHRVQAGRDLMVYSLNDRGISEIVRSLGLERDHIRFGIPTTKYLEHELMVTEAIRAILAEQFRGCYKIDLLLDDKQMKKILRSRAKTNEVIIPKYYSDIRLRIASHKGMSDFDIEIDMGTKSRSKWVPKICFFPNITLVLTTDKKRMSQLKSLVDASNRSVPTAFATITDFRKYGLKETSWLWAKVNKWGKIDF